MCYTAVCKISDTFSRLVHALAVVATPITLHLQQLKGLASQLLFKKTKPVLSYKIPLVSQYSVTYPIAIASYIYSLFEDK